MEETEKSESTEAKDKTKVEDKKVDNQPKKAEKKLNDKDFAKINQITNAISNKIANKGDPLANIIIKDNHYKNETTTKESSINN